MKRALRFLIIPIFLLTLMACEFAGITLDLGGGDSGGDGSSGAAPIESGIDSPSNGASLQMAPVEIAYHASSTGGVSAVELSINGEVLSSVASPASDQKVVALKYTWNPSVSGSHTIRVRAQSSNGGWSDYAAATVNIQGSQQQQEPPAQQQAPPDSPGPTPTPEEMTIYDIEHDKDTFYYGGGGCNREITISAKVTHPEDVYAMTLFIRFWDKEGAGLTKWDSGRGMSKKAEGSYSVTLFSENIPNYNAYEFAVMYYQITVTDKSNNPRAVVSEVIKKVNLQVCQ